MRKEILFAIAAGLILGLVVAFGIWRANSALAPKIQDAIPQIANNTTPTPSVGFDIAISSPENNDVITENPVTISGITAPNTWVTITGAGQHIIQSDQAGEFEQSLELDGGINQITVTALNDAGESVSGSVNVVYSSEFKVSNTEEQITPEVTPE